MPDTPPSPMRGRTTQKRVSARTKLSALLFSETAAITCEPSWLKEMEVTVPTVTSLYFTGVLPASSPVAVWKEMEIVGPVDNHVWSSSEKPISVAMIGTSQTRETRRRRRITTGRLGSGFCSRMSFMPAWTAASVDFSVCAYDAADWSYARASWRHAGPPSSCSADNPSGASRNALARIGNAAAGRTYGERERCRDATLCDRAAPLIQDASLR